MIIAKIMTLLMTISCLSVRSLHHRRLGSRKCLFMTTSSPIDSSSSSSLIGKSVVFLGTPDVAATVLEILHKDSLEKGYKVAAVVTQPPAKAGRKRILTKSPVHQTAEKLSLIPVLHPEKANDPDFLSNLESMKPDLCITAAYGNYLPKRFLAIPAFGTVNIHPSLLPRFRGAAPVQRCLEAGDVESGVTILETVTKMDAGDILYQHRCKLTGNEKSTQFLSDMFTVGAKELISILPAIFDKSVTRSVQDESKVTLAPKLTVEDARLDFAEMNARVVHNRVRGFADWPGTWTEFCIINKDTKEVLENRVRIKVATTRLLDPTPSTTATSTTGATTNTLCVLEKHPEHGFLLRVTCADGSSLGITEVLPPARRVMGARDYVNGLTGNELHWMSPEKLPANGVDAGSE